jgi:broad specificity phosphatase PhoE
LTKVILVRHGETEWNQIHRVQGGASDTPLSKTGKRQAEALGRRLKDEIIQAIYSSPLQRALDTAQEIARYHQLEIRAMPELKEINVGGLEGADTSDLKLRLDELICRNGANRGLLCLPGGESIADVQSRAWNAVQNISSQHPSGTVVVVTHYFVIMSIVCRVLNLPLTETVHLRIYNGTITTFTLDGRNNTRLELFNDGCHTLIGQTND